MAGRLTVVATPIGNLDDLSPRAVTALSDADIIACEDTRVTRTLLTRVPDARARLVSTHARNEAARADELVRAVAGGSHVALCTDAGMPGISDPGAAVIRACIDAGLPVDVVPGPSATLTALVLSGLPTARFVFEGFLPRGGSSRRERLESLASERRTIVLFEATRRLAATLEELHRILGDRRIAIARELTKIHEEVVRTRLGSVPEIDVRGEVTVVIEGASPVVEVPASEQLATEVHALVESGTTKKEAIATVAAARGVPKKVVYQAVLDA